MEVANLIQEGDRQVIILPDGFRFKGDKIIIKQKGNALILMSYEDYWEILFESLDQFSDDFMAEGCQQLEQLNRESFECFPSFEFGTSLTNQ